MERHSRSKNFLAQNFLRSPPLAKRLVGLASITNADVVYEIGPGTGILTAELAHVARQVIAVEKDRHLAAKLQSRFKTVENIAIVNGDFLSYYIPESRFKMFANIPFNITAALMRKILYGHHVPAEACLILQREPAKKYAGTPRETIVSLAAKPYCQLEIVRELRREDFSPVPNVDVVMLKISRRSKPLIAHCDRKVYRRFIDLGFRSWKPKLRTAFKHAFSYQQWKRLSSDLEFDLNAAPSELRFDQWLKLFEYFRTTGREVG